MLSSSSEKPGTLDERGDVKPGYGVGQGGGGGVVREKGVKGLGYVGGGVGGGGDVQIVI